MRLTCFRIKLSRGNDYIHSGTFEQILIDHCWYLFHYAGAKNWILPKIFQLLDI